MRRPAVVGVVVAGGQVDEQRAVIGEPEGHSSRITAPTNRRKRVDKLSKWRVGIPNTPRRPSQGHTEALQNESQRCSPGAVAQEVLSTARDPGRC